MIKPKVGIRLLSCQNLCSVLSCHPYILTFCRLSRISGMESVVEWNIGMGNLNQKSFTDAVQHNKILLQSEYTTYTHGCVHYFYRCW